MPTNPLETSGPSTVHDRARSKTRVLAACVAFGLMMVASPAGKAQTLTTLYSFCSQSGCVDGEYPLAGLNLMNYPVLYGTTSQGGGTQFPRWHSLRNQHPPGRIADHALQFLLAKQLHGWELPPGGAGPAGPGQRGVLPILFWDNC